MMTNLLDCQLELRAEFSDTLADDGVPSGGRVRGAIADDGRPLVLLEEDDGGLTIVVATQYRVVGRWLTKNDGRTLSEVLVPRGVPLPLTGGPVLAVPVPRE